MAQGINSRSEFPKLHFKTLEKAFHKEYNLGGEQFSKYWDVKTSTKSQEEVVETLIPSEVPVVSEGGMYSTSTLKMGRSKVFIHLTHKLEIVMTEELAEDNLYPNALRTQKALAIAMKRTVEKECAQRFLQGLTTELYGGAAGSSIGVGTNSNRTVFSTDHQVLKPESGNPTSWSNLLVGYEFGTTGVKKLKTLMRKGRDDTGEVATGFEMDQLLVGPDLYEDALEMYGSKNNFDTANLAKNQAREGLLEPILVTHFQDGDTGYEDVAYFGRDSRTAMNTFYWRVKPEYKIVYEEATGNIIQRVRCRYSMGFVNANGLVAAVPEL